MIGLVTVCVADGAGAAVLFYVQERVILEELDTLHAMAPLWSIHAVPDGEHSMGLCVWKYHASAERLAWRAGGAS